MEQRRAVTYNRCSTEEESQKDALIKQVRESENCIHEKGWKFIDTYVEAKSGTTVKGRSEYARLYKTFLPDTCIVSFDFFASVPEKDTSLLYSASGGPDS